MSSVPILTEGGEQILTEGTLPTGGGAPGVPGQVIDYRTLLTSEYRNSPNLNAIVNLLANSAGAVTTVLDSLPGLFDLDTAIAPQLDVDGEWIGQSRAVNGVLAVGFFGFSDDLSALGFNELGQPATGGRFIELTDLSTATALLGDPEYRTLLMAKILQNNWDADVGSFETALSDIVNTNNTGAPIGTLVFDPGTMVVSIMPLAAIDPVALALLTNYDILPRAAGVRYQYYEPFTGYTWTVAGTATASGTSVSKLTGTVAWNSAAWVAQPSAATYVSWTAAVVSGAAYMGGLSSNPSGSPNYPTLNYAMDVTNGVLFIYESGTSRGSFGAVAAGDTLAVLQDKKQVTYWHTPVGGTPQLVYTSTVAPTGSYEPMFALESVNASGPLITNVFIATGN